MTMDTLARHFWLLVLAVMLLNIAIVRVRLRALIRLGRVDAEQVDRFCIRAAIALTIVCVLFELTCLLTGLTADCQLLLPITHPRLLPFNALAVAVAVLTLDWIWRRGGDHTLAQVGPAFRKPSSDVPMFTPRQVRLVVTALLVLSWGGHIALRVAGPQPRLPAVERCQDLVVSPATLRQPPLRAQVDQDLPRTR